MKFDDIWAEVKPKVWSHALQSVAYHDAEDLVSIFSVYAWQTHSSGKFDTFDHNHTVAYLVRSFKHRVIDWIRAQCRKQALIQKLKQTAIQHTNPHKVYELMTDINKLADHFNLPRVAVRGVIRGDNLAKISGYCGLSRATLSRRINKVRNEMKQSMGSKRLVIEDLLKQNKGGNTMIVKEIRAGRFSVSDGDKQVAQVAIKDGEVRSVVMADKDADKDAVVEAVKSHMAETKPKVTKKKVTKKPIAKKAVSKTVKKVETPKPKVTKKKVAKKEAAPDGPSLRAHRKKIGGPGKCLCGCGTKCDRKFKPGHDMKLKSALKKAGKKKSLPLAKELGWDKVIKWDK